MAESFTHRLRTVLRMIKFEHSLFALPFALSGAWLAARGFPPWFDLLRIVVAAVFARSAAMAFNRVVDRRFDATNPRTENRELVTGALSVSWTKAFVFVCSVGFVATSFWIAPLCGYFSLPVLGILLGYSYLKRFTLLCHFGLGVALGCAPAGAWLAAQKEFAPGWPIPLWLGAGVLFWVAGFDLLYALQDIRHDEQEGLHSLAKRLGEKATRRGAMLLHAVAMGWFLLVGWGACSGWVYHFALGIVAFLLGLEHWMVRGGRKERIPLAFFQVNAWVGVVYFLGLAMDFQVANLGS